MPYRNINAPQNDTVASIQPSFGSLQNLQRITLSDKQVEL